MIAQPLAGALSDLSSARWGKRRSYVLAGAVLVALAPLGAPFGFGVLFLGAAFCAGASGILVWRLQTVR